MRLTWVSSSGAFYARPDRLGFLPERAHKSGTGSREANSRRTSSLERGGPGYVISTELVCIVGKAAAAEQVLTGAVI